MGVGYGPRTTKRCALLRTRANRIEKPADVPFGTGRSNRFKVVTAPARRELVRQMTTKGLSERRALAQGRV
ncbi:MAG: hypothetical protein KIS84_02380 [Dokdonella sp.]|nr:hypothetical protein [Dokdonella sp.]